MKSNHRMLVVGCLLVSLACSVAVVRADGLAEFKLARGIPADAMMVVHMRDHAGKEFVREQYERVWKAVQEQRFGSDLKRLFGNMAKTPGVEQAPIDVDAFEEQWERIQDLAASVNWARLADREFVYATKLAAPMDFGFVMLMLPEKGHAGEDFGALADVLRSLVDMAPDMLVLDTEDAGDTVVHRMSLSGAMVPMSLMVARHREAILVGYGTSMPSQSLALLRGEIDPTTSSLMATPRFRDAMKRLDDPQDGYQFVDWSRFMTEGRVFARMIGSLGQTMSQAETQPAGMPAMPSMGFLEPLVDELDLWDYSASVSATDGMQKTEQQICMLRRDALQKPFGKALYAGKPLRDPLAFVPQEATSVTVSSGIDLVALYKAITDFATEHNPEAAQTLDQLRLMQEEIAIDVERDLLPILSGPYTTFSAPIPTPFMPGSAYILRVQDEERARKLVEDLCIYLDEVLMEQQGGVEEARIAGAEGFKRVVLPPWGAFIPGLGRPVIGVNDGHLIIGNGPEIVTALLETAAGERPSFTDSERYQQAGLTIAGGATEYNYSDLRGWGEQMGTLLPAMAFAARMAAAEQARDPMVSTVLNSLTKIGNILRTFDFFDSKVTVTTRSDHTIMTRMVTHYRQPPKPKQPGQTADEPSAARE